jgi:hypothetical protein
MLHANDAQRSSDVPVRQNKRIYRLDATGNTNISAHELGEPSPPWPADCLQLRRGMHGAMKPISGCGVSTNL